MHLSPNKTKIVATIGPASNSPEIIERMLLAGMDVARLNFSHGDFDQHARACANLRAAAGKTGRRVAIMADLPGPKMRLGRIAPDPLELEAGKNFLLTTRELIGDESRASVTFQKLPQVVRAGDRLFLNDGLVGLVVDRVAGEEVYCTVETGGLLGSRKGLNLPGIPLGISAFTEHDRECLECALRLGVDAISQSFVENARDLRDVREAARALGKSPFLIAKIERSGAVANIAEILNEADGIMVARGDLGVEVPIEEIAPTQKRIIALANALCKPVITATQMLDSMIQHRLPTRAEATDVANAVLDGTDCLMLSGESAAGAYPVESVQMLARIAVASEKLRQERASARPLRHAAPDSSVLERKALLIEQAIEIARSDAVLVPTLSGNTARNVARWRPDVWILAACPDPQVLQNLCFTAGVHAVELHQDPEDWNEFAGDLVRRLCLDCRRVLLVAGPSEKNPHANQRFEWIQL